MKKIKEPVRYISITVQHINKAKCDGIAVRRLVFRTSDPIRSVAGTVPVPSVNVSGL
jgi:hypothetical protein